MTTLLSARGLRVAYGPVEAVKGIDLDVNEGEVVGLLGANGAGKSSTLRALSRMMKAGGSIELLGQDITKASSDKAARLGLVHVPEGRRLFPSLTAEENLLVGDVARGKREPVYTLADVYDLFPALPALRKRGGWALSGGEQQMVAIGRALMSKPDLILLDEPSMGLAPQLVAEIFEIVKRLNTEQNLSVLVAEQNTNMALKYATYGYILESGRVVMDGDCASLRENEDVKEFYLGVGSGDRKSFREVKSYKRRKRWLA